MKTKLKEIIISTILTWVIPIAILAALAILVALAIWGIFYIDDIDSKISILGIVAAIFAAFSSVMIAIINNKETKEREHRLHLLKEKQKVCEHFYNILFEILKNVKNNKGMNDKKIMNEMLLFKKGLMNWGSEELIKKYLEYEDSLETNKSNNYTILDSANTFLKELRKEFGFKDSKDIKLMDVLLTAEARKEFKQNPQSTSKK